MRAESGHPVEQLVASKNAFLAFIRRRVGEGPAEDIFQSSLLKAVESFDSLRDESRLAPWFYAILRNAITDFYRRQARQNETEWIPGLDLEEEPDLERRMCECFLPLLSTLKPEYAELVEADLNQEAPAETARRLGISANNLKVRHHRARRALRRRLEETCRVCARHHCMDCTCTQVA